MKKLFLLVLPIVFISPLSTNASCVGLPYGEYVQCSNDANYDHFLQNVQYMDWELDQLQLQNQQLQEEINYLETLIDSDVSESEELTLEEIQLIQEAIIQYLEEQFLIKS